MNVPCARCGTTVSPWRRNVRLGIVAEPIERLERRQREQAVFRLADEHAVDLPARAPSTLPASVDACGPKQNIGAP